MRVGAVDIGTNTVRLLVAERYEKGLFPARLEELDRRVVVTRLGRGVDRTGSFDDAAVEETVAVLAVYGAALRAWQVDVVDAIATSASRDAADRDAFLDRAELALGVRPRVIDGLEEARLSFGGAVGSAFGDRWHVVIDPGGGSTEFTAGRGAVEQSCSVDVGSVRVTERLLADHPATRAQVVAAAIHVDGLIESANVPQGDRVIGVGGTFTSLSAIALGLPEYDRSAVHGSTHDVATFDRLVEDIAAMSLADVAAIPSLDPARAPVLLGGAIVVARALHAVGADHVVVSESDGLDAVALEANRPSPF